MTDDERARELWELATKRLSEGQVEEAVKLFEQSIAVKPTAEGHTFRGWALSHEGHLDEAIEDCKQAIQLDPDFGNPYNDIGVYLMQKRHFNEAIPWLERAKLAKRYDNFYDVYGYFLPGAAIHSAFFGRRASASFILYSA